MAPVISLTMVQPLPASAKPKELVAINQTDDWGCGNGLVLVDKSPYANK